MERIADDKRIPVLFLLICLLGSYIITALMLFLLALGLYKIHLSEGMVSIGIIVIYVLSTFTGGYLAGKKLKNRKFLWGLAIGAAYFVVLALVSVAINHPVSELGSSVLTTLVLCSAGGMLGGMLS